MTRIAVPRDVHDACVSYRGARYSHPRLAAFEGDTVQVLLDPADRSTVRFGDPPALVHIVATRVETEHVDSPRTPVRSPGRLQAKAAEPGDEQEPGTGDAPPLAPVVPEVAPAPPTPVPVNQGLRLESRQVLIGPCPVCGGDVLFASWMSACEKCGTRLELKLRSPGAPSSGSITRVGPAPP